jgi:hypothetical protein
MKIKFAASLAACALALLSGCSFISKLTTPAAAPFVQVAVDAAVAVAVGTNQAVAKVKASQIKAIATQALAADTGTTATLSAIESVVNAQILKLNLPAGDVAAAQLLTATLTAVIQSELSSPKASAVTAQTQVAIAQVLNDVILATSAYGA